MTYQVKLDVFEGPIDLLLHLITRQRVDIYDVSLATITDEYLAALAALPEPDLEAATAFLVVAATLLELKASRLLPTAPSDEERRRLLEERDLLLARLVEAATFHEAGAWIAGQLDTGGRHYGRQVALEGALADLAPDLLDRVTRSHLVAAARRVLAEPSAELDTSYVAPIRASVRDAIVELCGRLVEGRAARFRELCPPAATRIEIIVRFLALLELYKAEAVDLAQRGPIGDIEVTWTGEATAEELVDAVEEYGPARVEG